MSKKFKTTADFKKQYIINGAGEHPIHVEPNCVYVTHRGVQESVVKKFTKENQSKLYD